MKYGSCYCTCKSCSELHQFTLNIIQETKIHSFNDFSIAFSSFRLLEYFSIIPDHPASYIKKDISKADYAIMLPQSPPFSEKYFLPPTLCCPVSISPLSSQQWCHKDPGPIHHNWSWGCTEDQTLLCANASPEDHYDLRKLKSILVTS